jgi:CubicO group peptidase (beta-lactamase class C family)
MIIDRRSFIAGALVASLSGSKLLAGEALADLASKLAHDDNIQSIAVATLEAGHVSQSFLVSGSPTSPPKHAVFQAASLSKPVVAFLALRLAQAGKLELDRPVDQLLPDGYLHRQNIFALKARPVVDAVPAEVLRQITPRMLLSHTAGFPNWCSSGALLLEYEPGSRWQYSGEGYVLLQHMIEVISSLSLQEMAERILFQPLELGETAFKITDSIQPRLAIGAPRQLRFPYEIASSSLYTSAEDYAKFVANILNDESSVSLITNNPVMLPTSWGDYFRSTRLAWGLGWGLEARDAPVSLWHWGSNPGFRSLVLADLRSHNAIVVLTSSENGMSAAKKLVTTAMPAEHPGLDFDMVQ